MDKTLRDEVSLIALRKTLSRSLEDLWADLNAWLPEDNEARTHRRRRCVGNTPMQTFPETVRSSSGHGMPLARDRQTPAAAA